MNAERTRFGRLISVAMLFAIGLSATGVQADQEQNQSQRARWAELYGEIAELFRVYPPYAEARDFKLFSRPLLNYSNPVRTWKQHGAVHLWTDNNRPAAIGSVWSVVDPKDDTRRKIAFEFHALTAHKVAADKENETVWKSEEAGLEWSLCADQGTPASSRALRLSQMRQLVRGVSAKIEQNDSPLRLLPQPLYRYPDSVDGVADGAVFGFVMGTDPELFAIIEARSDGKNLAWHWAFARFTHLGVTAKCADRMVFQCKHRKATPNLTKYFVLFNAEFRPALLDESPH